MAKLIITNPDGLGQFILDILQDPQKMAEFKADPKSKLKPLVTPAGGKTWDQINLHLHFDTEFDLNLTIPSFTDVGETLNTISPEGPAAGEPYAYPEYCTPGRPGYVQPEAGRTAQQKKDSRLRAYRHRIGDYIMTRCR